MGNAERAADLFVRDAMLVRQVDQMADQFLVVTARALEAEIAGRFGLAGPKALPKSKARSFADLYAQAMMTAYLYGRLHIQKQVEEGELIRLAEDDVRVPFEEAEDFLRSMAAVPRDEYDELSADLKFRAFTIARVGREDVIRRVQKIYQDHLAAGADRYEALQHMDEILDRAGVSERNPWWLQTHYRNNVMSAYGAGRWVQMQESDAVEFLIYNAMMDGHTTKLCRRMHGTIKAKADPFWRTYYPPNHHGCRSVVAPISRPMMRARGLKISTLAGKDIRRDPDLAGEHQFKAHPAATLKLIPDSLALRAGRYGLWRDIMSFARRAAGEKYWQRQINKSRAMTFSKAQLTHVAQRRLEVFRAYKDTARKTLAEPDEVWLMGTPVGDGVALCLNHIKWLSADRGLMVSIRGKPRTFRIIDKRFLDWVKEEYGAQRLNIPKS